MLLPLTDTVISFILYNSTEQKKQQSPTTLHPNTVNKRQATKTVNVFLVALTAG